jgi:hypothetical protein
MVTEQQKNTTVELVKERLGIRTNVRDNYITSIVDSVIAELEQEKGLVLDGANPYHFMFIVDYSEWRYSNKGSQEGMPRHLQFRLHNLMIHGGVQNDV